MGNWRGACLSVMAVGAIAAVGFISGRLTAPQPPRSREPSVSIALSELSARLAGIEQKVTSGVPIGCQSPSVVPAVPPAAERPTPAEKVVTDPPSTAEDERSESSASIAAFDSARTLLDGALARGSWGEATRDTFRNTLHSVSPARRQELVDSLVLAINSGKLVPTAIPPI